MSGDDPGREGGLADSGNGNSPASPTVPIPAGDANVPISGVEQTSVIIGVGDIANENLIAGYYREGDIFNITLSEMMAQSGFGAGPPRLTEDHFTTLVRIDLETTSSHIVSDDQEVERVLQATLQHRLVLIEGKRALGKGQLALKIAARLCAHQSLERLRRSSIRMTRHLQVDFHRLVAKTRFFEKSIILIEDAFDYGNYSLSQLAKATDVAARDALESSLRESNSWLILTYEEAKCPDLNMALLDRRQVVRGPNPEQLLDFLRQAAEKQIAKLVDASVQEKMLADLQPFLEKNAQPITIALATVPRIERFVREHLLKLLEGHESTLQSALAQTDQLDNWLFEEVLPDLPALTLVLALTICHGGPEDAPVRWFEFETLRQRLAVYLRNELGKHEEVRESIELCSEPDLFRRLRIEVSPGPGAFVIRFVDDRQAELLWNTLLGNGRQLAALLAPFLQELATAEQYFLRRLAGWALGKLSRLDHQALFGRLFSIWSRSSNPDAPQASALGGLIQSARASGDPRLSDLCLERIRGLLQDSDRDKVRTGLFSLVELGTVDLEIAVAEIRPVFQKWLLPCLKKLENLESRRRHLEKSVQERYGSYRLRSHLKNAIDQDLEGQLYSNLPFLFPAEQELKILTAAQYAIVGLSFTVGAVPVLRELKSWMPAGKAEMAPLLALLFLRPQGIVEVLEHYNIRWSERASTEELWSPILISVLLEERGVEDLVDFLFAIYLGACQLPHALERALTRRWMILVEVWTRNSAVPGTRCRELVLKLWSHLLRIPDQQLRQELVDLLDHPDFGIRGTQLGSLVEEIRQRRDQERSRRRLVS